jgi:hypothetical protein
LRCLSLAFALTVLAGYETLFQSNFDSTPIGQPEKLIASLNADC